MESHENILLSSKKYKQQRDYWVDKLTGVEPEPVIEADYSKADKFKDTAVIEYTVEPDIAKSLFKISKGSEMALFVVLLSAFKCFLYKYTGNEDICVASPTYTGSTKEALLNDILVLRNRISGEMTFKELILKVRESVVEAYGNQDYPFGKLIEELKLTDELALNLIFLSENIHNKDNKIVKDAHLVFSFLNGENSLKISVEYSRLLHKEEKIRRLLKYYITTLGVCSGNIDLNLRDINILSADERKKIFIDFNSTETVYPEDKTIQELFSIQAEKEPDRIAVVFEGERLTYRELDEKSSRLGAILTAKGVKPDNTVGIMVERSVDMIIAILGILKAGGAYLPIEPYYPRKRIMYMLNDSKATVLLTKEETASRFSFTFLQRINSSDAVTPLFSCPRPQIKDFDNLPLPDRSLIDYEKYDSYIGQAMVKNSIAIQATRGCPYNCAYCHKIWPKSHVTRSAENIFGEIELYYNIGIRRFVFVDDIFNLDRQNSSRLLKLIIKNGLKMQIYFPNGFRGDILTREFIDLLVEAGTVEFVMALETASPRLQTMIGKNLNIERFRENVEYITEKYPHVILDLATMHGFPTETKEEALSTIEFIKSIKWFHFPYIHILRIYPGTDMAKLAVENGISEEELENSADSAYHELPGTLPFPKSFTQQCQTEFLNEYFLSKERLLKVLPYQMKVLKEDELVQKYNSYLPIEINSFDDFLEFAGVSRDDLEADRFLDDDYGLVKDLNKKIEGVSPVKKRGSRPLKVLLLDLSQYFSSDSKNMLYNVVEPPLGLMYLMTYLNSEFGDKIEGKIAKSKIDFDSYDELKKLIEEFKPDVIGARSLTFYRDFFHESISVIRSFGIDVPIIAGGPYVTGSCRDVLRDRNINLAILGEGEITFAEIIGKFIEFKGELPEEVLRSIKGVAFVEKAEKEKSFNREVVLLDRISKGQELGECEKRDEVNNSANLAYVIYTSGTTGNPKGVMIEHRNVVNLVAGLSKIIYERYGDCLNIALLAPYVFDASVQQIFASLLLGHTLFIVPGDVRMDGEKLLRFYRENNIHVSDGTPTHLAILAYSDMHAEMTPGVKHFIIGGDVLPYRTVKEFYDKFKCDSAFITNIYGPTECCVDSTGFLIEKETLRERNTFPIGSPMANVKIYILGKDMKSMPQGVPGEIYISGGGVGRGYLNNPDLTRERFIDNLFIPGEKMYRTGDLGRWTEDGNIEFLHRMDRQVKIRGFRIELGEVETQLLNHESIMEAAAVVREDEGSGKYISAYIISDRELTPGDLRGYLSKTLPDYMIPSYFTRLDKMPLLPNGKIDRKSLPEPGKSRNTGIEYVPPGNEIEDKLVAIWQQVLGCGRIGLNDNFFNLGGDSIKAIQVSAGLRDYGLKIEISDLFQYPQIKNLARYVKTVKRAVHQGVVEGEVELTPVQRWFFANDFTEMSHFNQAVMLYSMSGFDPCIVNLVFGRIVEHHDALRMVYSFTGDGVKQYNRGTDGCCYSLEVLDFTGEINAAEKIVREAERLQASIDLSKGPLVKLGLFKTDDGDHLLIVIHHLVMDGISWRVLFEDLAAGYTQVLRKEEIVFKDKTDSFKEWAKKLRLFADKKSLLKEIEYWSKLEDVYIPPLPGDDTPPSDRNRDSNNLSMVLSEEETASLLNDVNRAYYTEINDILLSALGITFKEWTGENKILINMEGHGREEIMAEVDITRTVGWFSTSYPVLLELDRSGDLSILIRNIKEGLRRIPNKGIGYTILKYLTSRENNRQMKFNLKPEISFNYLGQFDRDIDTGLFSISTISKGATLSPNQERMHTFDINGAIAGGKLTMTFNYNKCKYRKETVQGLIESYRRHIVRIIDHCMGKETAELSPSDLGYKKLSLEGLRKITRLINDKIKQ